MTGHVCTECHCLDGAHDFMCSRRPRDLPPPVSELETCARALRAAAHRYHACSLGLRHDEAERALYRQAEMYVAAKAAAGEPMMAGMGPAAFAVLLRAKAHPPAGPCAASPGERHQLIVRYAGEVAEILIIECGACRRVSPDSDLPPPHQGGNT